MATATCTRCKASKPVEDFSPDPRRASGIHPHCRSCKAETERKRRATAKTNANVTPMARPPRDLDQRPELLAPPPSGTPGMGPYLAELERTLATLDLREVDCALAGLARGLARGMDGAYGDPREVALIAPKYLAALKALCATRDTAPAAAGEGPTLRLAAY